MQKFQSCKRVCNKILSFSIEVSEASLTKCNGGIFEGYAFFTIKKHFRLISILNYLPENNVDLFSRQATHQAGIVEPGLQQMKMIPAVVDLAL